MPNAAVAQAPAIGNEFRVNTLTANRQESSAVLVKDDGSFVIVWNAGTNQDGSAYGVFGRRFNAFGVAQGGDFQINTYTPTTQNYPRIAATAAGGYVVVWNSFAGQDGSNSGVFGRRFDSAGMALAVEFQINTYTTNDQIHPQVASAADGSFVVVWHGLGSGSVNGNVFGQRFDSSGGRLGGEFLIPGETLAGESAIAVADGGGFVVVWTFNLSIFGQRFDSAGTEVGAEISIGTNPGIDNLARVATHDDGSFVVVWNSPDGATSAGVKARRYDSDGALLGEEFIVNSYTPGNQGLPDIAMDGEGDFVVAFQGIDGTTYGIFRQTFDSAGARVGEVFEVNTYTPQNQRNPAIGMNDAGNFVVSFSSFRYAAIGNDVDIIAQGFGEPPPLVPADLDGSTDVTALTDGLLLLRYLFGFTGGTLANGATGAGCSRCDGSVIAAYLDGTGTTFDVDGNGFKEALTDGLLFLRWRFGFTGTTLTSGAVDTVNCTRCNATDIINYLDGLD